MPPAPKALEMSDKLIDAQPGQPMFWENLTNLLHNYNELILDYLYSYHNSCHQRSANHSPEHRFYCTSQIFVRFRHPVDILGDIFIIVSALLRYRDL
jgi:hypothetical protein